MSYRLQKNSENPKKIYNSRNYKCLIDLDKVVTGMTYIYNSRNYKCLIDQQKAGVPKKSTIVEIINVL